MGLTDRELGLFLLVSGGGEGLGGLGGELSVAGDEYGHEAVAGRHAQVERRHLLDHHLQGGEHRRLGFQRGFTRHPWMDTGDRLASDSISERLLQTYFKIGPREVQLAISSTDAQQ